MRYRNTIALAVAMMSVFFCLHDAAAQEDKGPLISHIVYGRLILDTDDLEVKNDYYDVDLLGFDTQQPWGGTTLKYGLEGGALLSWESEIRSIVVTGGDGGANVAVAADISALLIDVYAGVYCSFEPSKWVRIYAGAGPLVMYGQRETETLAADDDKLASESESGLGIGIYGRAGFDVIFKNDIGLTVGARLTRTTLSFDNPVGKVDVEGWEFYAGFVFRY